MNAIISLVAALLLAVSCLHPVVSPAEMSDSFTQMRQLAQLTEYIAVDYVEAVKDGEAINDGKYREMLEFPAHRDKYSFDSGQLSQRYRPGRPGKGFIVCHLKQAVC